ncbi:MAG: extracellular solute-binding protein [Candidatus Sumerlaeaceae bacterium]|nr:extracellular solute-binding protein [Candidatus Sumerlaeaceae bacterium]
MRIYLRSLSLGVLLALASLAVAAEEGTIRLVLWQGFKYSEVGELTANVEEFTKSWNASHTPRIEIAVQQVSFDDMVKRMKTAALAHITPDMAFVDANSMVSLVYGQVARPLDTLKNFPPNGIEELRKEYVPGAFDTNVVEFGGKKHLYGLPAQTTTLALFWNKKMFRDRATELKAAGLDPERPPRDWDEFIRYGKILTQPEKGLFAYGLTNSLWFSMPIMNQYGVSLVRRDENGVLVPNLSNPRTEAAVNRNVNFFLKDKVEAGAWREGQLDPGQGFLNQKYAMILIGPWMIENFRASKLDFGVALVPRVPLEEAKRLGLVPPDADDNSTAAQHLSSGNIGGQNLMVVSASKHPEVCFEFARFFSSEKVQRGWAEKLGQIPICVAAQKNLDLSKFPEVPTFIEQVNLARPLPPLPFGGTLEVDIVNPEINLVLQGNRSTKDALASIEKKMAARILAPVNEAEAAARDSAK